MDYRDKTGLFLGLKLHLLTMAETLRACESLIKERNKQHVVINAAKVVSASASEELATIINKCDLVNADGMAVVWAARLLGIPVPERVAGIDLMNSLVDLASRRDYSIYLLGAEENVIKEVASEFSQRNARIVGIRNGFWDGDEEEEIVGSIALEAPDILFIAIPSPAKEIFLSNYLQKLNVGLVVGVGGSFDIVAGKTSRAPVWAQRLGLEWLFRLKQEPRRMFKRYLVGNTKFILLVGSAFVKKLSHARKKK